jgi:hypothetical protein
MQIEHNSLAHQEKYKRDNYTFRRKEGHWYIEHVLYNGTDAVKQEVELPEGTDKLLDALGNGSNKMRLYLSLEPLAACDVLELVEHRPPPEGGGIYRLKSGRKQNGSIFWICDLALFVFADIPERIYVKRLGPAENEVS